MKNLEPVGSGRGRGIGMGTADGIARWLLSVSTNSAVGSGAIGSRTAVLPAWKYRWWEKSSPPGSSLRRDGGTCTRG
jgi:hypothetical protein